MVDWHEAERCLVCQAWPSLDASGNHGLPTLAAFFLLLLIRGHRFEPVSPRDKSHSKSNAIRATVSQTLRKVSTINLRYSQPKLPIEWAHEPHPALVHRVTSLTSSGRCHQCPLPDRWAHTMTAHRSICLFELDHVLGLAVMQTRSLLYPFRARPPNNERLAGRFSS
jgi:hypothetical protein